jgi:riboflavin kinase / FMN adenylyltransferase
MISKQSIFKKRCANLQQLRAISTYFCVVMKVYQSIRELPHFKNTVLTIGSFDGVHLGHLALIKKLLEISKGLDAESILITFHPHPRKVIHDQIELLTTLEEKIDLLALSGIEHLVIMPFTEAFSEMTPSVYVEKFLVFNFNPSAVVIGYDHRFGKNRAGDIALLRSLGLLHHFEVIEIEAEMIDQMNVSSSKIRTFLESGKMDAANALLGYEYSFSGHVVHGNKIGKEIGFPTANIQVNNPEKKLPGYGIYAVFVYVREVKYAGMLYIGNKPTLDGDAEMVIEVNIFDFNEEIYGETVSVSVVQFIRSDQKFETLESLRKCIEKDKEAVLSILS